MKLVVATEDDAIYEVEVDSQMKIEDLKAYLKEESNVAPEHQVLRFNGVELSDNMKTLEEYQVHEGDLVILRAINTNQYESMRQHVLEDPRLLQQLRACDPQLAAAALNDPEQFERMSRQLVETRQNAVNERQQMLDNLNPFDVEMQKRIEEAIRQENIATNLAAAMEYNPESFARVTRLYISVEINGHKLVALVDSGAQSTVISPETAEKCGLNRLIDTRYMGTAKGVGTAKITGRIHSAEMRLAKSFFLPCSFIVVEGKGSELLFGLDMLRRHRACIDLRKNVLTFDSCDIPFLAEHELPERQRMIEIHGGVDDDAQPASSSSNNTTVPPQTGSPANHPHSAAEAPPTTAHPRTYPEEHIKTLTSFGMSRKTAMTYLDMAGGNPDVAASLFFSK